MKSEAIKIAQIDRDKELIREVMLVLRHPVISIVFAYVVVEALQKVYIGPKHEPLMGIYMGGLLEGALIAKPMIEAAGTAIEVVAGAVKAFAPIVAK